MASARRFATRILLSVYAQSMRAEDYYESAYYEGKLDYKTDFCDEIDRIIIYIGLIYEANPNFR